MIESWGNSHYDGNLREETQVEVLQALEASDRHDRVGRLLFQAIRAADLQAIQNIMTVDNSVLAKELNGYEGTDLYDAFKSEDKKCYSWTGHPKDGYFYPLHVAAEAGNKEVCLHLLNGGASLETEDYIGRVPEQKANRDAKFAFYEHRGLKYEASERYVGGRDTLGRKRGRGILYRKEKGYDRKEMVSYRGNFKDDVYFGQGTLYWPGTDTVKYSGRFKDSLMHGRGVLFNEKGQKIYVGTFRGDERDGHGETYEDVDGSYFMTYKGEFKCNKMHGFGMAHFSEGHNFAGRFENNVKAGVGVYSYPNGDRFEGMFFNDKPDGDGSYYTKNPDGSVTAQHFTWQAGRKIKETGIPFVPLQADMPEIPQLSTSSVMGTLLKEDEDDSGDKAKRSQKKKMNQRKDEGEGMNEGATEGSRTPPKREEREEGSDGEEEEEEEEEAGGEDKEEEEDVLARSISQQKERQRQAAGATSHHKKCEPDKWKALLSKCVKMPHKLASEMGMAKTRKQRDDSLESGDREHGVDNEDSNSDGYLDSDIEDYDSTAAIGGRRRRRRYSSIQIQRDKDGDGKEAADSYAFTEEDDTDEVMGTHFLQFSPLFVAYVYVCSAQKVFEKRWSDGLSDIGTEAADGQQSEIDKEELQELGGDGFDEGFELVYNLVIDAVDEYNSKWEEAYKSQVEDEAEAQSARRAEEVSRNDKEGSSKRGKSDSLLKLSKSGSVKDKVQRKKMFMNETEKRVDLSRKQRAELAMKKGAASLAKEAERALGEEVVSSLEHELMGLLPSMSGDGDDLSIGSGGSYSLTSPSSPLRSTVRVIKASELDSTLEATEEDSQVLGDRREKTNEFALELVHLLKLAFDSL